MSPVQSMVGTAKAGKLTADQWRTFCTINLVVTLIRLWGDLPVDDRFHKILVNFMDLVLATNLAHMRTMTPERIEKYHQAMLSYLAGVLELYPHVELVPKHHLSLHLHLFLQRYGPVHSWRTFAFERLNLRFQNILTNSRIGQWIISCNADHTKVEKQGNLRRQCCKDFVWSKTFAPAFQKQCFLWRYTPWWTSSAENSSQ